MEKERTETENKPLRFESKKPRKLNRKARRAQEAQMRKLMKKARKKKNG
jgi:hypothetical protein